MADASHIGRRYEAAGQVVDAAAAGAVATAIAGSDEVFQAGIVPPTFAAVYCMFPTLALLFSDEEVGINLAGLVHGEQRFEWPSPVAGGDVVDAVAEITSVEVKRGMTFIGIELSAVRQSDSAVVCVGRSLMVVRG